DKSKVMDYLNKLNNFDAPDVAEIAVKNGHYEGAFNIYKNHDENTNAINCNNSEVWNRLAKAQIEGLRIKDTIDISSRAGKHEDLVKYLQMCRKKLCEPVVDTSTLVHLGEYQTVVDSARRPAVQRFGKMFIMLARSIKNFVYIYATNNEAVNEAYNDILIEEDYKSLRDSIDSLRF
ncbi:clathrin heavy chain 1, partial [Gigaspora margarita]